MKKGPGPGDCCLYRAQALPQGKFGGVLLSHNPSVAVPSALSGLASGFGMGPGVSLTLKPPKHLETTHPGVVFQNRRVDAQHLRRQVLGLLVPVNSTTHYCASISGLSTQWSVGGLNPQRGGIPHLGTGFPLRCLQRLSLPNVANQPCPWRDNWHTRGSSVPVLSY